MPLAYPPLPVANVSYGKPGYTDKAFNLSDAQGMYPRPPGRHGAWDWFAAGGEPVKAARSGRVVEVTPSRGNTGQVFGGVVKVEEPDGTVWVYRHVDPAVNLGTEVTASQTVAHVTAWRGGPSHLHMEIWRTLAGGYNTANAIDPSSYTFTVVYRGAELAALPDGDSLRLVVNGRSWAGWEEAGGPIRWIAVHGLDDDTKCAISWQKSHQAHRQGCRQRLPQSRAAVPVIYGKGTA